MDSYELTVELDFVRSEERSNGSRPVGDFAPDDMRLYTFIFVRPN